MDDDDDFKASCPDIILGESRAFNFRRAAIATRDIPADTLLGIYPGRRDPKRWESFVHDAPDVYLNVRFVSQTGKKYEIWSTRPLKRNDDLLGRYPSDYWIANYQPTWHDEKKKQRVPPRQKRNESCKKYRNRK